MSASSIPSTVSTVSDPAAHSTLPILPQLPEAPETRQNRTNPDTPAELDDATASLSQSKIENQNSKIHSRLLSSRQLTAITLLSTGKSDAIVAQAVGVTRQTVCTWRNHHPAFIAELTRRRKEIFSVSADRLRVMVVQALDFIHQQLKSRYESDRDKAAWNLLRYAGNAYLRPPEGPIEEQKVLEQLQKLDLSIDDSE